MSTVVGISGSLRKASVNTALLRALVELAPEGLTIELGSIREIPLYDGDLEAEHGIPPAVATLKDKIAAADALLIVTPEYNNSIPGVLKNAIDWLSRPPQDSRRVFDDKLVAIAGATPGQGGTLLAQTAWLQVLRALGAQIWSGPRLTVSGAPKLFDAEGKLVDEATKTNATKYLTALRDRLAK